MRGTLGVFLCLLSRAVATVCSYGYVFDVPGIPASTNLPDAEACQRSCSANDYCRFFSFDEGRCWLLKQKAQLKQKEDGVSGSETCLPRAPDASFGGEVAMDDEVENEDETSARIHRVIEKLAEYVAENSKNADMVKAAKHLEMAAKNGLLREEGYDNIMTVTSGASMLMAAPNSPDFGAAASMGLLLTRMDLDWLLKHCGEAQAEEVSMEDQGPDGDMDCPDDASCDQMKSYGAGVPWSNAQVKYCWDQNLNPSARDAVQCAMAKIRQVLPGITFSNVGYKGAGSCNSAPAVFVQSSESGCFANVGMIGGFSSWFTGNQKLNLQTPGCNDCGTAIHEMLHSMGMAHEQSRPDRDAYIQINWQNIRSGRASQFDVMRNADTNRPYDILSIMHYGPTSFTKNSLPTITVKPEGYALYTTNPSQYRNFRAGQRMGMSQRDVTQLADLYECATPDRCGGGAPQPPIDDGDAGGGGGGGGPQPVIINGGILSTLESFFSQFSGDQMTALILGAVAICVCCTLASCLSGIR